MAIMANPEADMHRQSRQMGFTLIELMIVIVVVAILTSLAVAGYGFAVEKSRRNTATACLMENAQFMERFYTTNLTYVGAVLPACTTDVSDFYTIGGAAAFTATAYTLQAVPVAGGPQADSSCGTLTINQDGVKTPTTGRCW